MNLSELQAELRHFAAERDWQTFHTPKNLSTALMVEAAGLAEIFQWMTPDESRLAHRDAGSKERIGEEVVGFLAEQDEPHQLDLRIGLAHRPNPFRHIFWRFNVIILDIDHPGNAHMPIA